MNSPAQQDPYEGLWGSGDDPYEGLWGEESVEGQPASMGRGAYEAVGDWMGAMAMREPDVDYDKGVDNFLFRAGLSAMDTDDERNRYLTNTLGGEGFHRDEAGRYIADTGGLERLGITSDRGRAIDEFGVSKYDMSADWAGAVPAALGAIGAGMFVASGSLAAIPGAAIVAAGAGAGKLIGELGEAAVGANLQSAGEVAKDVATEAAYGAGGELACRPVAAAARFIMGPNAWRRPLQRTGVGFKNAVKDRLTGKIAKEPIVNIEPERRALMKVIQSEGGTPAIYQVSPSKLIGRLQSTIHLILGNPLEAINYEMLERTGGRLIAQAGVGGSVARGTGAKEAGQGFRQALKGVQQEVDEAMKALDDIVAKEVDTLHDIIPKSGSTKEIDEIIRTAKGKFDKYYSDAYGAIDELLEGKPIVFTSGLKMRAAAIFEDLPKTGGTSNVKQALKEVQGILDLPDVMTFRQMYQQRIAIREALGARELVGTMNSYKLSQLYKGMDDLFDDVIPSIVERTSMATMPVVRTGFVRAEGASTIAGQTIPVVTPNLKGIKALKTAQMLGKGYRSSIRRFDRSLVKRLAKQLEEEGSLAPSQVARAVLNSRDVSSIKALRQLVNSQSEGAWNTVQERVLRDLTQGLVDSATGKMNPHHLHRVLTRMGDDVLREIFVTRAPTLKRVAKDMASLGGKPTLKQLKKVEGEGPILEGLQRYLRTQRNADKILKNGFIEKVRKGEVDDGDIVKMLLQPANKNLIKHVKKVLGRDSKEWANIKTGLMDEIIQSMYVAGDDPIQQVIRGDKLVSLLENFTNKWTNTAPLEDIFGKELTASLKEFSEVSLLLTRKKIAMSGGILAASIALHPIRNLPRLMMFRGLRRMFLTDGTLKMYTEGLLNTRKRSGIEKISRTTALLWAILEDETKNSEYMFDAYQDKFEQKAGQVKEDAAEQITQFGQ